LTNFNSWAIALFGHSWHIFDNEACQLVIGQLFYSVFCNLIYNTYGPDGKGCNLISKRWNKYITKNSNTVDKIAVVNR
jgi:hypothetical protein